MLCRARRSFTEFKIPGRGKQSYSYVYASDPILQIKTSQSLDDVEVRGPSNCETC